MDDSVQASLIKRALSCLTSKWRANRLIILIILGVILGICLGIGFNSTIQKLQEPTTTLVLLGFPGEILMRMLQMLVQPLIVCSLIVGLASLGQHASGRVGKRAIIYYLSTTVIAIFVGLILVFVIQPGKNASVGNRKFAEMKEAKPLYSFLDFLRNLFPENIVQAAFQKVRTTHRSVQVPLKSITVNLTSMNDTQVHEIQKKYTLITEKINSTTSINRTYYVMYKTIDIAGSLEYAWGSNNLGLVMVATFFGLVAGTLGTSGFAFTRVISNFNDIIMQLIIAVMWFAPVGICSLLIVSFARMENIYDTFSSLALLLFTCVFGMVIQSLVVYPSIYFFTTRRNPFVYMKGITQALITAFGTSSSAATLPVTLHCIEDKNGVDKKISRFILPIGVTVNMDGSALYNAVTTIYLAQVYKLSLSFGTCLAVSFAAVMASIGAAGVPSVTPVMILIVLQAAGIPVELISLIYAVDWLLDRFQTVCNVCGDCFGAGIVEHLSKKDLKLDKKDDVLDHFKPVEFSKWI